MTQMAADGLWLIIISRATSQLDCNVAEIHFCLQTNLPIWSIPDPGQILFSISNTQRIMSPSPPWYQKVSLRRGVNTAKRDGRDTHHHFCYLLNNLYFLKLHCTNTILWLNRWLLHLPNSECGTSDTPSLWGLWSHSHPLSCGQVLNLSCDLAA